MTGNPNFSTPLGGNPNFNTPLVKPAAGGGSILGGVTVGLGNNVVRPGQRIVIAAVEKMGKTTLTCSAPNALLVPLETDMVALMRYRHTPVLSSWNEVIQLCEELVAAAKAGKITPGSSLVWDSATMLERFIHTAVLKEDPDYIRAYDQATGILKPGCKPVTMESALGGYGKPYTRANEHFATWMRYMDELARHGGINIIVTCHVFPSKVVDPAHGEYDTWDLLLHSPKNNKTYGKREMITQWADMVGFLHEPMFTVKSDKEGVMTRGVTAGQGRALGIDRTPAWVAGNRYGMSGVINIPLNGGWNQLAHAIYESTRGAVDLYNREGQ
jgi:hypothetical protein